MFEALVFTLFSGAFWVPLLTVLFFSLCLGHVLHTFANDIVRVTFYRWLGYAVVAVLIYDAWAIPGTFGMKFVPLFAEAIVFLGGLYLFVSVGEWERLSFKDWIGIVFPYFLKPKE